MSGEPTIFAPLQSIPDMTVSYRWLQEYLPVDITPERLCLILNSIGLEVEGMETFEEIRGGLLGLVTGEVLHVERHPNADKLSLTRVRTTGGEPLQIVCGAPNVAVGQKVVVAPVGATIYPLGGDPLTMKVAKIRGVESHGMICAEDEIGLGTGHDGILVLPEDTPVGIPAAEVFKPYTDQVIHIGLTPNRSDAMSHLGVARDVCAYLNHHEGRSLEVKTPLDGRVPPVSARYPIEVSVPASDACPRYSGVSISGVTIQPSPLWMQQRLKAIGLRPINNIVDITNYILHETGQPLHAFDADRIGGGKIIVQTLPKGTAFTSLDEKQRTLDEEDLMICDGSGKPMCIGGVFGGLESGVTHATTNIFLESAWFDPVSIRKSSFRHNLRTDAATRFEKGVDIGGTVNVLKRAASMICMYGGGSIASDIVDVYPKPAVSPEVSFTFDYLQRLSGKHYPAATVREIMQNLGFGIIAEDAAGMTVRVPLHKTDVRLPADIAEEVMRIDGFDNITIPSTITFSPASAPDWQEEAWKEKAASVLVGLGFHEMVNNSITSSAYYNEEELAEGVRMMNSLSAELDMMRPSMLETGLQSVSHNLNRKNLDLRLFEFGKTYRKSGAHDFGEADHLAIFLTGQKQAQGWQQKAIVSDLFHLKGILKNLLGHFGLAGLEYREARHPRMTGAIEGLYAGQPLVSLGMVHRKTLDRFDIRQEVWYADIQWQSLIQILKSHTIRYRELPRFPGVQRDLAIVVDSSLSYDRVEQALQAASLARLRQYQLFDVFESDKLGTGKKSLALNFRFRDEEKTLTDEEVENMMQKIIRIFEKDLQAQVRR
jgi:phenylalanyl-tRNA synthetase beta chain